MKKGWDKYASKERYIKKGYLRKYRNGSEIREASKASSCNSVQQSREDKEEIELLVRPELPLCLKQIIEEEIEWFNKCVSVKELNKKEEIDERIEVFGKVDESKSCQKESREHQDGSGGILVMPDVPRKRTRRKRKADSDKRNA